MSSTSAFNPSRIRKDSTAQKVERRGRATFAFPDAYKGTVEFFEQRPIDFEVPLPEESAPESPSGSRRHK